MDTKQIIQLAQPVIILFLMPMFLVYIIGYKKHTSRVGLFSTLAFAWSLFLYLYVVGLWPYLSYYLRYFFLFVFILLTIKALQSLRYLPKQEKLNFKSWASLMGYVLISLFFFSSLYFAIKGYTVTEKGIDIDFPLKDGYVGHGGNSVLINYHHADSTAQQYAVDIVKINAWGSRTSNLLPSRLEDYVIFGDTLYSPCDAKVVVAKDGLDNLPAGVQDNIHLAGNNVVLEYDNSLIVFAHLLKNSLLVSKGDVVKKGEPMARIGNSGHTSEPHLHMHAISGTDTSKILNGNGIPIYFNGAFAVRNNILKRKE